MSRSRINIPSTIFNEKYNSFLPFCPYLFNKTVDFVGIIGTIEL